MEDKSKTEEEINSEVERIHNQIQPALYEYYPHSNILFEEKDPNVKMEALEKQGQAKDYYSWCLFI